MPTLSQNRPALNIKMQQCANLFVATMVSQQFVADPFTTDFIVIPDKDRFQANTEGGDVIANVTIADMIEGKPYVVEKIHADNTLTVHFTDGDFEGDADIALTGDGDAFAFVVRSGVVRLAFPSGVPGAAPDGALAADQNLADLDDADTALDNLGGTTVGKAVFTAVDAAAARTAIGAPAATAVVLKADKFTFGPMALDTVAANADAIRFRPGFAGTLTAMVLDLSKSAAGLDGTVVVTPTVAGGATTPANAQHAAAAVAGNIVDTAITNGGAFTADQEIVLATTGTNTVAGKTMVTLEYTRT